MVALSDNFDDLSDGDYLYQRSSWTSNKSSAPAMRSDRHSDTDDGTQVLDGSADFGTLANAERTIFNTPLTTDDHTVGLDCFTDSAGSGTNCNWQGVIARSDDTNATNCYWAVFMAGGDSLDTTDRVGLWSRVAGSSTEIASWTGFTPDTTSVYRLELKVSGSTISVKVDGVERISVTDTDHTAGKYAGIYFVRGQASTDGQPWVDNWTAADDGVANVTLKSSTSQAAGNGASITLPFTAAEGDTVLAIGTRQATLEEIATDSIGWTLVAKADDGSEHTGSGGKSDAAIWSKVMGATPDTDFKLNWAGGAQFAGALAILVFDGAVSVQGDYIRDESQAPTLTSTDTAGLGVVVAAKQGSSSRTCAGTTRVEEPWQNDTRPAGLDVFVTDGPLLTTSWTPSDMSSGAAVALSVALSSVGGGPTFAGSPWKDSSDTERFTVLSDGRNSAVRLSDGSRLE